MTEESPHRGQGASTEYYFNTRTGEVEEGKKAPWMDRMGPYPSREDALHAYQLAASRNSSFDAQDTQWADDWGEERS